MRAIRGTARRAFVWASLVRAYPELLPRYPGPDVIPLIRVPGPPALVPDAPAKALTLACAQAYHQAVQRTWGRCGLWFGRAPTIRTLTPQQHAELLPGARALAERRRPPLVWALFSARVWRAYHHTKRRPVPLRWTFAPSRINRTELDDWYAYSYNYLGAGRVVLVPAQQELVEAYTALQRTLLAEERCDELAVRRAVQEILPDHKYKRLVAQGVRQARERSEDLEFRIAAGEYVW